MKLPSRDFVLEEGRKAEAMAMHESKYIIRILDATLDVVAIDCDRDIISNGDIVTRGEF